MAVGSLGERERRAAQNQSSFREVNEGINDINQTHNLWLALMEWVRECADETCTERVELTPEQYDASARTPRRSLLRRARSTYSPTLRATEKTRLQKAPRRPL